ncbi:hypothetical protein CVT24_006140 [Panaeolus cyanescens]|uniref:DUF7330 domain-containing protein n=1 Tax=Panaeolus cyanescens TaxID=181874 RepID=A0A409WHG5_9AGAR|nr:hypothetical protein CVT24_006140 [Panaeolus cyanescens]
MSVASLRSDATPPSYRMTYPSRWSDSTPSSSPTRRASSSLRSGSTTNTHLETRHPRDSQRSEDTPSSYHIRRISSSLRSGSTTSTSTHSMETRQPRDSQWSDDTRPILQTRGTSSSLSGESTPLTIAQKGTRQPPTGVRPRNFVQFIRAENFVKATWVIDPNLIIPPAFLPPLPEGLDSSERPNLLLVSDEGSVQGDIYIKPINHDVRPVIPGIISIYARSKIELNIHDTPILHPGDQRLPIRLKATSYEDDVRIYLPRSFSGPLYIKTQRSTTSSVFLSPAIRQRLSTISQDIYIVQGFIGRPAELDQKEDSMDNWEGDSLEVNILYSQPPGPFRDPDYHDATVKLYFDEEDQQVIHRVRTSLRKLLFTF